jgi:hypothetical protein
LKNILLFGAGKSATVLINYLLSEAELNNWMIIVVDANQELILEKTKSHHCPSFRYNLSNISNGRNRPPDL